VGIKLEKGEREGRKKGREVTEGEEQGIRKGQKRRLDLAWLLCPLNCLIGERQKSACKPEAGKRTAAPKLLLALLSLLLRARFPSHLVGHLRVNLLHRRELLQGLIQEVDRVVDEHVSKLKVEAPPVILRSRGWEKGSEKR